MERSQCPKFTPMPLSGPFLSEYKDFYSLATMGSYSIKLRKRKTRDLKNNVATGKYIFLRVAEEDCNAKASLENYAHSLQNRLFAKNRSLLVDFVEHSADRQRNVLSGNVQMPCHVVHNVVIKLSTKVTLFGAKGIYRRLNRDQKYSPFRQSMIWGPKDYNRLKRHGKYFSSLDSLELQGSVEQNAFTVCKHNEDILEIRRTQRLNSNSARRKRKALHKSDSAAVKEKRKR